jgi:hypothetical protein
VARPTKAYATFDAVSDAGVAMIEAEGLGSFCRALYNSSEFLFVF